jgi:hypothetical protein
VFPAPACQGCWSQGASEEEALQNIQDAITEYLSAIDELVEGQDVRGGEDRGINRAEDSWSQSSCCGESIGKSGLSHCQARKHIVMSDGIRILTIPRHNRVNAFTMGGTRLTLVCPSRSLEASLITRHQISLAADAR